jgi:ATP synthase protein I
MESLDKNNQGLFTKKLEEKVQRKLKAKHNASKSVWFGLGMMGLVGWTITVPTLLGAALGMWLDKRYPNSFSWTLSLLIIGLLVGCFKSWNWILKEHKELNAKDEKDE